MYIGLEISVASVSSPNPFNILDVGIGNSYPSSSLSHEQSNHQSTTPPPLVLNNIRTNLHTPGLTIAFEPSRVTRYYVNDIIGDTRSEFAVKCWESIRNKIVCTLVHYIPNLAGEVEKILHSI